MTLKQYLFLMSLATLLCLAALTFVMYAINPDEPGQLLGKLLFYISFFLSVFGLFSLIVFSLESLFARRETVAFRTVRKSFRQGVLFAVLITVVLLLARAQMLFWWTILLLALGLSCIEFLWAKTNRTSA